MKVGLEHQDTWDETFFCTIHISFFFQINTAQSSVYFTVSVLFLQIWSRHKYLNVVLERKHREDLRWNIVSHFKPQSCHERWTVKGFYGLFIRAHYLRRGAQLPGAKSDNNGGNPVRPFLKFRVHKRFCEHEISMRFRVIMATKYCHVYGWLISRGLGW
jgi:hypothetical protein